MRKLTTEQAKALALARGATLELPEGTFNSAGMQLSPSAHRYRPGKPAEPSAPEPTFTRADVERMLDARDAKWRAEITALKASMPTPVTTVTMDPVVVPAPVVNLPPVPEPIRAWAFDVEYHMNGAIKGIKARAA